MGLSFGVVHYRHDNQRKTCGIHTTVAHKNSNVYLINQEGFAKYKVSNMYTSRRTTHTVENCWCFWPCTNIKADSKRDKIINMRYREKNLHNGNFKNQGCKNQLHNSQRYKVVNKGKLEQYLILILIT